ncbi:MAG: RnfABCDGE type electron transport complex subunit G [Candidatus Omnitrophica bacterium]|nr:RnfABCDGE type electron transport complex subunit G [Candidatus Omnitrophota bacterium]
MKYLKIILVLTSVSVFSAGILSLADLISKEKILENQAKAVNEAIAAIVPEAERIEEEEHIYRVFDKKSRLLGYIFLAEGQGYQGKIKMICGISPSLDKLLGIEILESQETPGLGARIAEGGFKDQFKGLNVLNPITYLKSKPTEDSQIQAITGATVSSRSVVSIINNRVEEIRKILK